MCRSAAKKPPHPLRTPANPVTPPPPAGRYLEIFGRKNNLRDFWVTVGNEVTGQGPPTEDREAIDRGERIPGATYGRGA